MSVDGGTKKSYRLVAVDDEQPLLDAYRRLFRPHGFETICFNSPAAALEEIRDHSSDFDVLILDVQMPEMNGIEVLGLVKEADASLPVIMITADSTSGTAVQAIKAGAFNYLTKPLVDVEGAAALLRGAAENRRLQRQVRELQNRVDRAQGLEEIVGQSEPMQELFTVIERVAPLDINVLVLGESGTGKELVARAIHRRSKRANGPFVALNCAAIPETLVDSELFGHKRGAFTGAVESRAGAFENANGGTLFLDEIGDIPQAVQIRLLRVLQEREVTRLGTDSPKPIDVRVIAATLADLESAVASGDFREDLFYRLNVVCLQIPPLRNRSDDIPLLATHLLERQAKRVGLEIPVLEKEALNRLTSHHWPGNVRELENAIQRALALHQDGKITADLFPQGQARPTPTASSGGDGEDPLAWTDGMTVTEARRCLVDSFERDYVTRLLERTSNNISEAARQAGIDRSNLRRMMSRVGIKATSDD